MKKILLLTASAVLLLASCQKSNVVAPQDDQNEISFQSYSGREATKAGNPLGDGATFNVAAFYKTSSGATTATSYYTSLEYSWDSTNSYFKSSTPKYWPANGVLDFYAVMPSTITADKKVKPTINGSTDFSAAYLKDQTNSSSPKLTFGHKLTKVAFKAIGADTNLMYEITGITLTAKDTATFDIATGKWGSNGTKTYEYTVLNAKDTVKAGTATAKSVGSTLYLLPKNTASIKVKYNVYSSGQLIDSGASGGVTVDLSTTSADWAINSSYVYTLTLNLTSSAKPITFNAEQTDWGSESNNPINVKEPDIFEPIRVALTAAASASNKVVTLTKDYEGKLLEPIVIPSGVTLNVSGRSLKATSGTAETFISVPQGAKLIANTGDATRSTIVYHSSNNEASVITVVRPSSNYGSPENASNLAKYPIQFGVVTISSGASDKIVIKCKGPEENAAVASYIYKGTDENPNISYYIGTFSIDSSSGKVIKSGWEGFGNSKLVSSILDTESASFCSYFLIDYSTYYAYYKPQNNTIIDDFTFIKNTSYAGACAD